MSSQAAIDLDITKTSRFRSNVWFLMLLLMSVLGAYAAWRDLRESDSVMSVHQLQLEKDILELKQNVTSRIDRQEQHLEFNDTRLVNVEQKLALTSSKLDDIQVNVEWLRRHQENQDRRGNP